MVEIWCFVKTCKHNKSDYCNKDSDIRNSHIIIENYENTPFSSIAICKSFSYKEGN